MNAKELNKDIKRLRNEVLKTQKLSGNAYYEAVDNVIKPEFKRLYYADTTFEYMNEKSVKIMLRLNVLYRFVPFHQFGLMIELNKI